MHVYYICVIRVLYYFISFCTRILISCFCPKPVLWSTSIPSVTTLVHCVVTHRHQILCQLVLTARIFGGMIYCSALAVGLGLPMASYPPATPSISVAPRTPLSAFATKSWFNLLAFVDQLHPQQVCCNLIQHKTRKESINIHRSLTSGPLAAFNHVSNQMNSS